MCLPFAVIWPGVHLAANIRNTIYRVVTENIFLYIDIFCCIPQ